MGLGQTGLGQMGLGHMGLGQMGLGQVYGTRSEDRPEEYSH